MSDARLEMWVVYDHPEDMPEWYVARMHVAQATGSTPTGAVMRSHDLETLRSALRDLGLTCLARHPSDDPKIVETWL